MAPLNTTMHHVDKTQPHDVSFDRDKSLMRIVETPGGFGPTVRDGSVIRVHLTVHTPNEEGDGERLVYDSATTSPSGLTLTVGFTDHVCAPVLPAPSHPPNAPPRVLDASELDLNQHFLVRPGRARQPIRASVCSRLARACAYVPSPLPHLRRPISAAPSQLRHLRRAVSTARVSRHRQRCLNVRRSALSRAPCAM